MAYSLDAMESELATKHESLRRGDFDLQLLGDVRNTWREWIALPDEMFAIRGACVAAEVFDYFGEHAAARQVLDVDRERILTWLAAARAGGAEDQTPANLAKRRLWFVMNWAHCEYRSERHSAALDALHACQFVVDRLDPEQRGCFGTRARNHYSIGQVLRQEHEYDGARREFHASIAWATRRFRQRTSFAERDGPPRTNVVKLTEEQQIRFDREKKLADRTIGKAIALGIGWIHYVTGRLDEAEGAISAGLALLRSTEDTYHRAYCELLLQSVRRARLTAFQAASHGLANRPLGHRGTPLSTDQIALLYQQMQEAAAGLSTHPTLGPRSEYELAFLCCQVVSVLPAGKERVDYAAKARLHAENFNRRGRIRTGEAKVATGSRWAGNALILKARLCLIASPPDCESATTHSSEALDMAVRRGDLTAQIDARLIAAEIDMAIASAENRTLISRRQSREKVLASLLDLLALNARTPNARTEAFCHLYAARTLIELNRFPEAHYHWSIWSQRYAAIVEHGDIRDLAKAVERQLAEPNAGFFVPGTGDLNFEHWKDELLIFLLRRANSVSSSIDATAEKLGRDPSQVSRWQARFRKQGRDVGTRTGALAAARSPAAPRRGTRKKR